MDASLSGGEVKRIEIATILARKSGLMIFDEPEAGIDLWSFSMLVDQFEKIHSKKDQKLILISHQEKIIKMADRIMVIEDGKIRSIGSKEEMVPKLFGESSDCKCAGRK